MWSAQISGSVVFSESKTLWSVEAKYHPWVMVFSPSCFHPSNSFSSVQTDCGACVLWARPATDPWLNWLSQGVNGLPASSCGLGATVRPVALSPSVSLRGRDIIVSLLVVLKSQFVDVEDFDRVVGAGAGQLDPGALLLDFTLSVRLSILLVVHSTYSACPGPPAKPLYCQRVALSAKACVMKGNNRILLGRHQTITWGEKHVQRDHSKLLSPDLWIIRNAHQGGETWFECRLTDRNWYLSSRSPVTQGHS